MPTARLTGWRIAPGTISAASLTSAYAVTDFPLQSDMDFSTPWTINGERSTTPTPARVTTNGDLSRSPDGFYSWAWCFDYMTCGATEYWNETLIPGEAWWAYVTAMTYSEKNQAMFFNAKLWKPNYPSDKAQYARGGWAKVIYQFEAGTQIFP